MFYYCRTDVARVRISSDKLWKLQYEVSIVENGNELYEYCNLPCREEYWLENNSRRVNKDISFVFSVFELYD